MTTRILSLRSDIAAVVILVLDQTKSAIALDDDADYLLWKAMRTGFLQWCRHEVHCNGLTLDVAAATGLPGLLRAASQSEIFREACARAGCALSQVEVLDLAPALCATIPQPLVFSQTFSIGELATLPPPGLSFPVAPRPVLKAWVSAFDFCADEGRGLPIVWEATYADLVRGERPKVGSRYGELVQAEVELVQPDGTFPNVVPPGMRVTFAPLVDYDDEVILLESSAFTSRRQAQERVNDELARGARAAVLARVIFNPTPLGLTETVVPKSVTITEEPEKGVAVLLNLSELEPRLVHRIDSERLGLLPRDYALKEAKHLAESLSIPLL